MASGRQMAPSCITVVYDLSDDYRIIWLDRVVFSIYVEKYNLRLYRTANGLIFSY